MEEVWRSTVKPFYEVSNFGNVRSLDRYVKCCYGSKQFRKGQILSPRLAKNGYLRVQLGQGKVYPVHRLVVWAFPEICGVWFEGAQVNHKNYNKTDNCVGNLEVVDCRTNINYGSANERRSSAHKKPVFCYDQNGVLIKKYECSEEAAKEIGRSRSLINMYIHGNVTPPNGYKYSYEEK